VARSLWNWKGCKQTHQTINEDYQTRLQNRRLDNKRGLKSKTKPVHGVQSNWLLNIDLRKIIIPVLHIEIGLINKFNAEVTGWMQLNGKGLNPEYKAIHHQSYLEAMEDKIAAMIMYEASRVSIE
jgi:hypothetical protein